MSDTPRTDAVERNCRPRDGMGLAATLLDDVRNHARQLERERNELLAALTTLCNAYASDGNTKRQKAAFAQGRALMAKMEQS